MRRRTGKTTRMLYRVLGSESSDVRVVVRDNAEADRVVRELVRLSGGDWLVRTGRGPRVLVNTHDDERRIVVTVSGENENRWLHGELRDFETHVDMDVLANALASRPRPGGYHG